MRRRWVLLCLNMPEESNSHILYLHRVNDVKGGEFLSAFCGILVPFSSLFWFQALEFYFTAVFSLPARRHFKIFAFGQR